MANTIGVTKQHKAILENVYQEKHSDAFEITTEEQKKTVIANLEEI